jgi:hypothetical protein
MVPKTSNFCKQNTNSKGTTFYLGRSSNSQHNLNQKFRKENKFEIGLNFKGIQTFEEKNA